MLCTFPSIFFGEDVCVCGFLMLLPWGSLTNQGRGARVLVAVLAEDLGCTAKQQQVDRVARRSERELQGQPRLLHCGKGTRRVPARSPRPEDAARRVPICFRYCALMQLQGSKLRGVLLQPCMVEVQKPLAPLVHRRSVRVRRVDDVRACNLEFIDGLACRAVLHVILNIAPGRPLLHPDFT